jgi:hypothetical protein
MSESTNCHSFVFRADGFMTQAFEAETEANPEMTMD